MTGGDLLWVFTDEQVAGVVENAVVSGPDQEAFEGISFNGTVSLIANDGPTITVSTTNGLVEIPGAEEQYFRVQISGTETPDGIAPATLTVLSNVASANTFTIDVSIANFSMASPIWI